MNETVTLGEVLKFALVLVVATIGLGAVSYAGKLALTAYQRVREALRVKADVTGKRFIARELNRMIDRGVMEGYFDPSRPRVIVHSNVFDSGGCQFRVDVVDPRLPMLIFNARLIVRMPEAAQEEA